MQGAQRKVRPTPQRRPVVRPEFVAAVRYPDGTRDLFHIRNADSLDDARELVMLEVGDVQSVMIALRH